MKNEGLKPPIIWINDYNPPKMKEQWVPVVGISLTKYLELGWATTVVSRCTVPWLRERERERDEGVLWRYLDQYPFGSKKNANIFFGCKVLVRPG